MFLPFFLRLDSFDWSKNVRISQIDKSFRLDNAIILCRKFIFDRTFFGEISRIFLEKFFKRTRNILKLTKNNFFGEKNYETHQKTYFSIKTLKQPIKCFRNKLLNESKNNFLVQTLERTKNMFVSIPINKKYLR